MDALKIGDMVPIISLPDQHGNLVNFDDFINKHPLVIYFYPKDDTPGCTREACGFRDQFEVFQEAGAKIFGISADSPKSHLKFIERYRLPFSLLSDQEKKVQKQFGVSSSLFGLLPGRVTFIIDREGIIRKVFNSQFQASKHVEEAVRVIRKF
ncbi:MAG: peroxiredoxin [Bacteroidetes bacterium]|nr:peroxiredoxin [Bacteroidota bacterium]